MNQYRLTRRGKLVILSLLLLLIFFLVIGSRAILLKILSAQDNNQLTTSSTTINLVNEMTEGSTKSNTESSAESTTESLTANSTENSSENSVENPTENLTESQQSSKQVSGTNTETVVTSNSFQQGIVTSEDERNLLNASCLILFEQDKAELSEDMKSRIRIFARTASSYRDFEITVRGVALKLIDIQKSEENAILRANAVSLYLTSLGIEPNKIKVETKIVDPSDYETSELSKAIAAELFFSGYQKEMK